MIPENKKSSSASQTIPWLYSFGFLLSFVGISFLFLFPLLVPAITQNKLWFRNLFYFVLVFFFSHYLILGGLRKERKWFRWTLASQLIFGALFWLGYDVINVPWNGTLLLFKSPFQVIVFLKVSFWLAIPLVVLGVSLLFYTSLRNLLGTELVYLSFHFLFLSLFIVLTPRWIENLHLVGMTDLLQNKTFLGLQTTLQNHFLIAFGVAGCLTFGLGCLLLEKGKRVQTLLFFTVPLWLPLFGLFLFLSLTLDTAVHYIEEYASISFPPVVKWLLSPLLLLIFPFMLLTEFFVGMVWNLGSFAVQKLLPPDFESRGLTFVLGTTLFLLLPLWIFPFLFFSFFQLFLVQTIFSALFGQKAFKKEKP